MKLTSLLRTGTLLALPAAVIADGWNLAPPSLSSFLEETEDFFPTPFLRRSSFPQHQLVDDAERFQVTLDLEGVPDEDVHVSIENNGMTLLVHGHREVVSENYRYQGSFSQRFSLSPAVQVDEMVATRRASDGKLIITAPKDPKRGRPSREIPIQSLEAIESGLSTSSSSSASQNTPQIASSAFMSSEQEKAAFVPPSSTTTEQKTDKKTTGFKTWNDSAFVTTEDLRQVSVFVARNSNPAPLLQSQNILSEILDLGLSDRVKSLKPTSQSRKFACLRISQRKMRLGAKLSLDAPKTKER